MLRGLKNNSQFVIHSEAMMREVLIFIVVVQMGRAALLACWARVCEDAEELGVFFSLFRRETPALSFFTLVLSANPEQPHSHRPATAPKYVT